MIVRENEFHSRPEGLEKKNAPRVAISGVTGYVGRELAYLLASSGSKILGLTRQGLSAIAELPSAVTLERIESRTEYLCELFESFHPDVVIHLAALARRDHLVSDVSPFLEANILLGTRLLEAMRYCGCNRFITAESVLQFSDTGESRATNLYAATKLAFAEMLKYYTAAFGISAISLVLPTLYSESETRSKLMTDVAAALLNGSTVAIQAGEVKIDFVHVEDVARALELALGMLEERNSESGFFSRYWVSSGRTVTPRELVSLFERIGEKQINVQWRHSQINSRRMTPWHGPVLPEWIPHIDLETGIRKMLSPPR